VIRVLIIDDSAIVRKSLADQLRQHADIEVIGSAVDPYHAREMIVALNPDVLTLDLEMPRMDGLSFLAKLMKHHPLPVVVVSSLAPENSETAIRAFELGAVEVVCKPGGQYSATDLGRKVAQAIRAASMARPVLRLPVPVRAAATPEPGRPTLRDTTDKVIAIGASTGGTNAIEVVLTELPPDLPGIVIVQHMPENFTAAFAQRMNAVCAIEVREARDGDWVTRGVALIAPGNHHLLVQRNGARYVARVKDGPAVHHQRPAVDVLFDSVASSAGRNALGVILTGMGADGARGLLAMKQAGARTLAQDEKSSIVFGMPKEAIALGAADEGVPLPLIAQTMLRGLKESEESRAA
jgi:two-component system, chemotaxis family, protein-glutamate methylesterase/glutaminase